MEWKMEPLTQALADHLAPQLPLVHFYQDPIQQGTQTPALFLQIRENQVVCGLSGVEEHILHVVLTYREALNGPQWLRSAHRMAHQLDQALDTLPLPLEGEERVLLRPLDRRWEVDEEQLTYHFSLKLRLRRPQESAKMGRMDYQEVARGETVHKGGAAG